MTDQSGVEEESKAEMSAEERDDAAAGLYADDPKNTEGPEGSEGTTEEPESSEEKAKEPEGSEEKAAGAADEESDDSDKEEPDSGGAPENYADFEVPEGFDSLDEGQVKNFLPLAKKHNLSQVGAQAMIDLFAGEVTKMREAQEAKFKATHAGWMAETLADKSLQDENGDTAPAFSRAKTAILKFGGEPLMELLKHSGMEANPHVVKAFSEIGKMSAEGRILSADDAPQERTMTQEERATELYEGDSP